MIMRVVFQDDTVKEYAGVSSFYGGLTCGEIVLNFPVGLVTLDFDSIKTIEFIKGV